MGMPSAVRRLRDKDYARYKQACRTGGKNAARATAKAVTKEEELWKESTPGREATKAWLAKRQ